MSPHSWKLSADGIYYALNEDLHGGIRKQTILFYDFMRHQTTEVCRNEGSHSIASLAVSPDEQWILFTGYPPLSSELVLVENFR